MQNGQQQSVSSNCTPSRRHRALKKEDMVNMTFDGDMEEFDDPFSKPKETTTSISNLVFSRQYHASLDKSCHSTTPTEEMSSVESATTSPQQSKGKLVPKLPAWKLRESMKLAEPRRYSGRASLSSQLNHVDTVSDSSHRRHSSAEDRSIRSTPAASSRKNNDSSSHSRDRSGSSSLHHRSSVHLEKDLENTCSVPSLFAFSVGGERKPRRALKGVKWGIKDGDDIDSSERSNRSTSIRSSTSRSRSSERRRSKTGGDDIDTSETRSRSSSSKQRSSSKDRSSSSSARGDNLPRRSRSRSSDRRVARTTDHHHQQQQEEEEAAAAKVPSPKENLPRRSRSRSSERRSARKEKTQLAPEEPKTPSTSTRSSSRDRRSSTRSSSKDRKRSFSKGASRRAAKEVAEQPGDPFGERPRLHKESSKSQVHKDAGESKPKLFKPLSKTRMAVKKMEEQPKEDSPKKEKKKKKENPKESSQSRVRAAKTLFEQNSCHNKQEKPNLFNSLSKTRMVVKKAEEQGKEKPNEEEKQEEEKPKEQESFQSRIKMAKALLEKNSSHKKEEPKLSKSSSSRKPALSKSSSKSRVDKEEENLDKDHPLRQPRSRSLERRGRRSDASRRFLDEPPVVHKEPHERCTSAAQGVQEEQASCFESSKVNKAAVKLIVKSQVHQAAPTTPTCRRPSAWELRERAKSATRAARTPTNSRRSCRARLETPSTPQLPPAFASLAAFKSPINSPRRLTTTNADIRQRQKHSKARRGSVLDSLAQLDDVEMEVSKNGAKRIVIELGDVSDLQKILKK